ncbi:iron complex outermembrane receptor protein [Hephaestia caeni]|uniref:Iron complex outermembrane receptor protein n=1 Tax=Hephaestia caeni TaxID=645617 RepID=A0A397NT71_9SPHN|nr:TonB-dependent siderophore receptor [Hephaestia caeni]RIA36611.1 iron complex outermembrane receptor protein [Hephaestia caeni]
MVRLGIGLPAVVALCLPAVPASGQDAGTQDASSRHADIVVTGLLPDGSASASKADIPVLETSQAISILSEQLIEDQGVRRLGDALYNVAGVSRSNTYGFFDGFKIRGFEASSGATYLDGLREDAGYATTELAGLERIEVVKGPASGLFGQGPLSGIVNLVSKRPREDAFLDVSLAGGSYDLFELQVDGNAPLTRDGSLLARVAAVYRDQDFFVDYSGQRRLFIAPALTWKPGPDTSLTLLGRYVDDKINPWSPTTAYGTALPNPNGPLPIDLSINDGDYPAIQENDNWNLGYVFDHAFSDAIAVHQSLRYQNFHNTWDHWLFVSSISDDFREVGRFYYGPFDEHGDNFAVDTNVSLRFATGPIGHYVLAGLDYGRRESNQTNLFDGGPYWLDLYDPVYGTVSGPDPDVAGTTYASLTRQRGFYLQDHLTLGDVLTVTLGGRWDRASSAINNDGTASPKVVDTAFSPRAGATLAIGKAVSLYVNYAKSFNPQGSYRASDGSTLPPEHGVNYEAGVKVARADGTLTGIATVFELTRTNVATADLSPDAPPNTYVLTGEQRTRGIELEAAWRPLPGVELSGAYSFLDAKVTADSRLLVGARLSSVPRHVVNLWGRYTVQKGPFANLGAGLGLHHESNRPASTASATSMPFYLDSYTLADAAIFYTFGDWSAQANVRNIFNERYFPTASLTRTTPGEPRTFVISLSRRF